MTEQGLTQAVSKNTDSHPSLKYLIRLVISSLLYEYEILKTVLEDKEFVKYHMNCCASELLWYTLYN